MSKSILSQFRQNRDERPDEPAFLIAAGDRSVPITWREFAEDVEEIAWIVDHYAPNAVVGLLGENSYEWITAHAAGLFAGVTVVPLEVNLTAKEIVDRLAFTGATYLVHSALYVEKAREVERMLPGLVVGGFGSHKADELMALARAALDMGDDSVFDLPERDEDETAMIVFTSGTTSKPRGAELTLRGIRTFVEFAAETLHLQPDTRSLMMLPLYHIFGICSTYAMLCNGVSLGVCPDFRRIYDAVARFRANFLFLVPALADILAGKIAQRGPSAETVLGTPIDWILVGGAPLVRRTYERLTSLGICPIGGYGLTETTSLYSLAPVDDPRPGSAGKCCHGFGGMEAKVSEEGELLLRGPAVLKDYYKEPERTADVLDADGWFRTGDIGRIDEDGYVWITGRASRTIILSSGKKVAPEELEEKILSIPGIHEVVVSGDGASRDLVAEIYAVVSEETARRQIDVMNRQLPVHKRIHRVVTRKEPFPRTASGKIQVRPAAVPAPIPLPPLPKPPAPKAPEIPTFNTAPRTWLFWTVLVVAIAVFLFNLAGLFCPSLKARLPAPISGLVDGTEILLSLFALLVVFVALKGRNLMMVYKRRKRK
ncbi:MAG: acyl--CoA ligase [Kiritimatiellae bacterium]|nr:acyl--CoA ligase [Kiritimatiellia bacterium]